ncbi:MAG: DUF4974 domain-containing protein [Bacteroidales bacterium]|nr:DUF4974 domain-containing protein [Bacteroidales bacterium]
MTGIENTNELIARYLSGNTSREESKSLEDWLNQYPENRSEYDSIKEVWDFVSRPYHMSKVDVARARAKVKKEIPEFRSIKNIFYYWQRVAAVIILPVFVAGVLFFYVFKQRLTSRIVQQEITASYGVRSKVNLPDGTDVWLNSGSRITFPSKFLDNKREVFLEGEALFNVADDKLRPFYVNLGEVSVKAIGTTFNVAAYQKDNTFETTLISGKVLMVKQSSSKSDVVLYKIEPRQHAVYNKQERKITVFEDALPPVPSSEKLESLKPLPPELSALKNEISDNKYTSWIEGKLIFRNDPMDAVIKRLERWYNVDIQLKDTLLYDFRYTATFVDETLEQVLGLLKLSAPISYSITEREEKNDKSYSKKKVVITLIRNK